MSSHGNDKSAEDYVPLAEHELLKVKYEFLVKEHERLIKILEVIEETHGLTSGDVVNKKKEPLVAKEEIEKWENKIGEMLKRVENIEMDIGNLMSIDESEKKGMDTGTSKHAKTNVKNKSVSKDGVMIVISDDEDEGNQRENNEGQRYSSLTYQECAFTL